jgi:hypothetical protein
MFNYLSLEQKKYLILSDDSVLGERVVIDGGVGCHLPVVNVTKLFPSS